MRNVTNHITLKMVLKSVFLSSFPILKKFFYFPYTRPGFLFSFRFFGPNPFPSLVPLGHPDPSHPPFSRSAVGRGPSWAVKIRNSVSGCVWSQGPGRGLSSPVLRTWLPERFDVFSSLYPSKYKTTVFFPLSPTLLFLYA